MGGGELAAGFSDFFYNSADGLRLHARVYGSNNAGALPVICLPGLTRNARDFHELALFLSQSAPTRRKVVAFDYRGRGQSAYDPDWKNYNIVVEAGDVLAGLAALGIDEGCFIGTSRGGLILHILAAMRAEALKAVVLNDIGPLLEAEGLAHILSYLGQGPKPNNVAEAIAFQRSVHGPAFPALTDADWERFVKAIYRFDNGVPVADFDPALLNGFQGVDLTKPLPDMWKQFEDLQNTPMLVIRGENSKLLSQATLSEMTRRHSACETITVEGQGHAPFLETGILPTAIGTFFDRADSRKPA